MSETTRTYELGYLLVPTVPEAQLESTVVGLSAAITAVGGNIVGTGAPEFIDLAYIMEKSVASKTSKYSQGYFGWLKFDADPETMDALKKAFDANADVIRYLLVKTNAQNTVIFKKPKVEARRESDSDASVEAVLEDDLKEDHEKLPDVEGDILDETGTQAPEAAEEKDE